jgi:hypothetical protein
MMSLSSQNVSSLDDVDLVQPLNSSYVATSFELADLLSDGEALESSASVFESHKYSKGEVGSLGEISSAPSMSFLRQNSIVFASKSNSLNGTLNQELIEGLTLVDPHSDISHSTTLSRQASSASIPSLLIPSRPGESVFQASHLMLVNGCVSHDGVLVDRDPDQVDDMPILDELPPSFIRIGTLPVRMSSETAGPLTGQSTVIQKRSRSMSLSACSVSNVSEAENLDNTSQFSSSDGHDNPQELDLKVACDLSDSVQSKV